MKNKINTRYKSKKTARTTLVIIGVVLVAALAYAFIARANNFWPFPSTSDTSSETKTETSRDTNDINYSPPTDEEKASSQDGKKNSSEQETASTKSSVSVGIAYAGYDEQEGVVDIRAFTPDIIEGTGTCTATLTKDSTTITEKSSAFIDYSSTQCNPITIPLNKFPSKGTWTLVVSYVSPTHNGTSKEMEISL